MSGDVLMYWPGSGSMLEAIQGKFNELNAVNNHDSKAIPEEGQDSIPCYIWDLLTANPVRLRPIPRDLPRLPATGLSDDADSEETRLIKIAGLDNNLIGLTNKGHVLRYNNLEGEENYQRGQWEYVSEDVFGG